MLLRPSVLRSWYTSCRKTAVRGFKRKSAPHKDEVPESEGVRLGLRGLVKPFGFTVLVSGCSYIGCTVWEYENKLSAHRSRKTVDPPDFFQKAGSLRQRVNDFWNGLDSGRKVAFGIIGINAVVLLMWRTVRMPFMRKWFSATPYSEAPCWPMLLSAFSHYSLVHICCNMYVLLSFSSAVTSFLGREQFLNVYLTAGVVASLASYAYKVTRFNPVVSLGASGAIMAMLGLVSTKMPDARLSIAFVSDIFPHSFSAKNGITALLVFDSLGLLLGWRLFDHAAHLGGLLFGMWYGAYGEKLIWKRRLAFITWWHKMRTPKS